LSHARDAGNCCGGDVVDPVGSDHETYRQTAQMIEAMLEHWLDEMGF
jgi:protein-tyrosine-phosphatase